jgi:hypothetical protein
MKGEKNMGLRYCKRTWAGIIFLLIILSLMTVSSCTKSNGLTKGEAQKLITEHIQDSYGTVPVGEFIFNVSSRDKFDNLKKSCEQLKKAELIDYTVLQSSTNLQLHIRTWLTEKGKNSRHIYYDDDKKILGFIIGKRTVSEIVKIEGDTILFSYEFETNELGNALDFIKGKYRGKAKVVFDPLIKKFVFKGLQTSNWEREKWMNSTWFYEKEGTKVFTLGIKEDVKY